MEKHSETSKHRNWLSRGNIKMTEEDCHGNRECHEDFEEEDWSFEYSKRERTAAILAIIGIFILIFLAVLI